MSAEEYTVGASQEYVVDAQAQQRGVSVVVTVRVEEPHRYPDRGELGEIAGTAACRTLGHALDGIARHDTQPEF